MSQRTVGIISGVVLLVALISVQVLRLADQPDRSSAIVQGTVGFAAIAAGVAAVLFGQEIVSARRWRRAITLAPSSQHQLIAVGDFRAGTPSSTGLFKVGLFIDDVELAVVSLRKPSELVREISLSKVELVSVEQLDSSTAWATLLDLSVAGEEPFSLTLDGWRLRSRRRLYQAATTAAQKIREGIKPANAT